MIEACKSPLCTWCGTTLAKWQLSRYFFRVRVQFEQGDLDPTKPVLLIPNHSAWLDTQLALYLVERVFKRRFYMMAAVETMSRHRLMSYYGSFSVDTQNPMAVVQSLLYAAYQLKGKPNNCLVVFPQGNYYRSTERPLHFQPGAAQIARLVKDVTIVPMAIHYDIFLQKQPEIYVRIGKPLALEEGMPPTRPLVKMMEGMVSAELDQLQDDLFHYRLDKFETILHSPRSLLTRIRSRAGTETAQTENNPELDNYSPAG